MRGRRDWRVWLERNHDVVTEVWLVFYKKHTGKACISYDAAVEEALCFGWVDSIIKRIDEGKFVRKFTPRKAGSRWSESNKERAKRMMREGRMTESGLAQIREAKKSGQWFAKALPKRELEVPQFVKDALAANPIARRNFDNLAKSYRRHYIGWVVSAKREETRKRRLVEVIGRLEKNEKLGMK